MCMTQMLREPYSRKSRVYRSLIQGMTVTLLILSAVTARAQFVGGGGVDFPLLFKQEFSWDWPAIPLLHGRPNWGRILTDTPGPFGSRNLTVKVRHEKRP